MTVSLSNPLVSGLIGAIVGLVVGWLWRNVRVRELDRELSACRPRAARLNQVEEILAERNGQLAALQTELGDLLRERGSQAPPVGPPEAPTQASLPLVGESPKRRKSGPRAAS